MRRAIPIVVALAAVCGCGAPAELSRDDGTQLAISRDRIVAAVQTERQLSGSPAVAGRLVARVRKVVSSGALEPKQLDEFGLAALGELHLAVPSLAVEDRQGVPRQLDREALRTFLAEATTNPSTAMRRPARVEVRRVASLLDRADAGPDTDIPVAGETAGKYVDRLESQLRPVWPDLANELAAVRQGL